MGWRDELGITDSVVHEPDYVEERGFWGDLGASVGRGVMDLTSLSSHAYETITGNESGLDEWSTKIQDKYLKQDVSEYYGKEGFLQRGVKTGVRSLVPSLAGAAPGAVAGAGIGSLAGPVGTAAGGIIGGMLGTLGLFGAGTYGEALERGEADGLEGEELHKFALNEGIIEGGVETLATGIELATFGTGAALRPLTTSLKQMIKTPMKELGKKYITTAATEVSTEMFQSGASAYNAEQFGVQTAGILDSVKESIVPALFMTGVINVAGTGWNKVQENAVIGGLRRKDPNAVASVTSQLQKQDPELAQEWVNFAAPILEGEGTFDVDMDLLGAFKQRRENEVRQAQTIITNPLSAKPEDLDAAVNILLKTDDSEDMGPMARNISSQILNMADEDVVELDVNLTPLVESGYLTEPEATLLDSFVVSQKEDIAARLEKEEIKDSTYLKPAKTTKPSPRTPRGITVPEKEKEVYGAEAPPRKPLGITVPEKEEEVYGADAPQRTPVGIKGPGKIRASLVKKQEKLKKTTKLAEKKKLKDEIKVVEEAVEIVELIETAPEDSPVVKEMNKLTPEEFEETILAEAEARVVAEKQGVAYETAVGDVEPIEETMGATSELDYDESVTAKEIKTLGKERKTKVREKKVKWEAQVAGSPLVSGEDVHGQSWFIIEDKDGNLSITKDLNSNRIENTIPKQTKNTWQTAKRWVDSQIITEKETKKAEVSVTPPKKKVTIRRRKGKDTRRTEEEKIGTFKEYSKEGDLTTRTDTIDGKEYTIYKKGDQWYEKGLGEEKPLGSTKAKAIENLRKPKEIEVVAKEEKVEEEVPEVISRKDLIAEKQKELDKKAGVTPKVTKKKAKATPKVKKGKTLVFHGHSGAYDTPSISKSEMGVHVTPSKELAESVQNRYGDGVLQAYQLDEGKTLLVPEGDTGKGNWDSHSLLGKLYKNDIVTKRENDRLLRDLSGIKSIAEKNEIVREFLTDKGYSSIKYLNRYEHGTQSLVDKAKISRTAINKLSDQELIDQHDAQWSYIVLEPTAVTGGAMDYAPVDTKIGQAKRTKSGGLYIKNPTVDSAIRFFQTIKMESGEGLRYLVNDGDIYIFDAYTDSHTSFAVDRGFTDKSKWMNNRGYFRTDSDVMQFLEARPSLKKNISYAPMERAATPKEFPHSDGLTWTQDIKDNGLEVYTLIDATGRPVGGASTIEGYNGNYDLIDYFTGEVLTKGFKTPQEAGEYLAMDWKIQRDPLFDGDQISKEEKEALWNTRTLIDGVQDPTAMQYLIQLFDNGYSFDSARPSIVEFTPEQFKELESNWNTFQSLRYKRLGAEPISLYTQWKLQDRLVQEGGVVDGGLGEIMRNAEKPIVFWNQVSKLYKDGYISRELSESLFNEYTVEWYSKNDTKKKNLAEKQFLKDKEGTTKPAIEVLERISGFGQAGDSSAASLILEHVSEEVLAELKIITLKDSVFDTIYGDDVGGIYNSGNHTIHLRESGNNGITVHEIYHALTVRGFIVDPEFRQDLHSIFQAYQKAMVDQKWFTEDQVYQLSQRYGKEFTDYRNSQNFTDEQRRLAYSLTNPKEMISEMFSRTSVRDVMKATDAVEEVKLLDRIKNAISKMFGRLTGERNMFEQLLVKSFEKADMTGEQLKAEQIEKNRKEINTLKKELAEVQQGSQTDLDTLFREEEIVAELVDLETEINTLEDPNYWFAATAKSENLMAAPATYDQEFTTAMLQKHHEGPVAADLGDMLTGAADVLKKVAQPITERLRSIEPKLIRFLRKMELAISDHNVKYHDKIKPFMESYKALDPNSKLELSWALKNSDEEAMAIRKRLLGSEYEAVEEVLRDIHGRMETVGLNTYSEVAEYFPRRVKDMDGLMKYLRVYSDRKAKEAELGRKLTEEEKEEAVVARENLSRLEEALLQAQEEKGKPLNKVERESIVNKTIHTGKTNVMAFNVPGAAKARTIGRVNPEMDQFYYDSVEALIDHIYRSNEAIETRNTFNFTNRNKLVAEGNKIAKSRNPDLDRLAEVEAQINEIDNDQSESLSSFLSEQGLSLPPEKVIEVVEILRARLNQKGTYGAVSSARDLMLISTLSSPTSAITQLQDLTWSIYYNGPINTIASIFGTKRMSKKDFDLERSMKEFNNGSSKWVDGALKYSGLQMMDLFGKEVFMESTLKRVENMDQSKFLEQNGFKFDTEEIAIDTYEKIKSGNLKDEDGVWHPEVKFFVFNELSNVQPISLSEMPQAYLQGGNGRIFYTLKTYQIKQFNNLIREIRSGKNKKEAMVKFGTLAMLLTLAGASADELKDLVMGRSTTFSDHVHENILKLAFLSKYTLSKGPGTMSVKQFLTDILVPPVGWVGDPMGDMVNLMSGEPTYETLKDLPWGAPVYSRFTEKGKERNLRNERRDIMDDFKEVLESDGSVSSIRKRIESYNRKAEDKIKYAKTRRYLLRKIQEE